MHFIFWVIMLVYYTSSSWPFETNKIFLFERMLSKLIVQIVLSYIIIYILVPFFLNKKRKVLFAISSLIVIYLFYVLHTAIRCYYLVPKYPEIYSVRPPLIFIDRITNVYAFLSNITGLIFPTILLTSRWFEATIRDGQAAMPQGRCRRSSLIKPHGRSISAASVMVLVGRTRSYPTLI